MTTPTHHQSQSVSISVFKPDINPSTPSYNPTGELIDDTIAFRINSYSHTIKAVGGYWEASFTLNDRLDKIEDWIDRIGYHVEVYSPSLVKIWEGFISDVLPNIGGLSIKRGPLGDIGNDVFTVYSTVDTSVNPPIVGQREKTTAATDSGSQDKYGIIEKAVSVGGATQATAEQVRDTWITENALPMTSQQFNSSSSATDPGITITCLGYVWFLNLYVYNQTASSGTRDISDIIQDVLAADPNGLFSTDYSKIETNTLEVKRYVNNDSKAWDYLRSLISKGNASSERFVGGVLNDRVFYYKKAETDIEYQLRIADPKQRVETLAGLEIKPWSVQADKKLILSDFLVGKTVPTNNKEDERISYLESVTYNSPWTFSYQGGKTDTLSQLLAQSFGLGGSA